MTGGRDDRKARLMEGRSGSWGSSSQDFVRLSIDLFQCSAEYAQRFDGNVSPYSLAGIPMLFSAFRCILIELHAGLAGSATREGLLKDLAESPNDVHVFLTRYRASDELRHDLELLHEVRNEIIHPAHLPAGTVVNTPQYLMELRERRLLQSTGRDDSDYIWVSQLKSHRLFQWAFEVLSSAVVFAIESDGLLTAAGYAETWTEFRGVSAGARGAMP